LGIYSLDFFNDFLCTIELEPPGSGKMVFSAWTAGFVVVWCLVAGTALGLSRAASRNDCEAGGFILLGAMGPTKTVKNGRYWWLDSVD